MLMGGILLGVRATCAAVRIGRAGSSQNTSTLNDGYNSNQPYQRMDSEKCSRSGLICCVAIFVIIVPGIIVGVIFGLRNRNNNSEDPAYQSDHSFDYKPDIPTIGPIYGPLTRRTNQPNIPDYGPRPTKPPTMPDYVWKMKTMMSQTQPCDDFYQHACGGWIKDNPATDYQSHNRFGNLNENIRDILKDLLGRKLQSSETEAVKKAKALYRSCMNTAAISSRGSAPLITVLEEVRGGDRTIVGMLTKITKYRQSPLGALGVTTDPKDASKTAIVLDQPNLPLRLLNEGSEDYIGYTNYIQEVISLLESSILGNGFLGHVSDLVDFQRRLTELTTAPNDRPPLDVRYNKYKLGDLDTEFPGFDWKGFIKGVFSLREVNVSLTDDEPVIVYAPDYFRRVGSFLSESSHSTTYRYVQWQLIEGMLPYLSYEYRTAKSKLFEALGFSYTEPARWKTCTEIVDTTMANATGRLFVDKEFEPAAMDLTREMVADIRKVFKERMQGDSWMDNRTKQTAIEKLDAMEELIGYPPEIKDNTKLDQEYKDLRIGNKYFENIVAVLNRLHWRNLRTLHQPTLRTQWGTGPTTVNAFYQPDKNIMVIPAGILRKPFFSVEYPKAMLYGSLGLVVAHEMTHGFDNTGRKYDKDGSLVQWWSSLALSNYRTKAKCYVNQYSSYTLPDVDFAVYLNGTKTLGENIADNGGVRDAFNAYTEWTKRQKEKVPELPYLGLTNNQVFYLTFAQRFCEKTGSEQAQISARQDVHSPGALRVKGTLQNSNHFAQTFTCAKGMEMNPHRQKCRIW